MIDNLDKIIPTLKCKHRKLKFLYVNSDIRGLTMEKNETGRHISKQFDLELEEIRNKVLAMGGFVEYQILEAAKSLVDGDYDRAALVITNDLKVNKDEIRIDEDCNYIIARHSILSIAVLFLAGAIILYFVDEKEGARIAQEMEAKGLK